MVLEREEKAEKDLKQKAPFAHILCITEEGYQKLCAMKLKSSDYFVSRLV